MSVDRSKTSPFLLRVFIRPQSHNDISNFNPNAPALQRSEHGIYVWKDTSLRELVILLRSVAASYQRPGNAKFSIRHVYTSSRSEYAPTYDYKDLGLVFARDLAGEDALEEKGASGRGGGRNDASIKTLEQHRVIPGDFIDIAFITAVPGASSHRDGPPSAGLASSLSSGLQGGGSRGGLGGPTGGVSINGLAGRLANNGPSEADRAWGIAGDQTVRRRPGGGGGGGGPGPMRQGGPSGSNRLNPLLSNANGRAQPNGVNEERGISIMGAGRKASATGDLDRRNGSHSRRSQSPPRGD